jgi:creatinine amidohydrolase
VTRARMLSGLSGPAAAADVDPHTVALQPIGATEHHGPHLPLGTDALIAAALSEAVSTHADAPDLIVLPTLSYGLSTEHVWAPGTVTMSPTTLSAVLDDVAASMVRLGVTRLAILNTHGGNTDLLRVACREIRAEHGLMTFLVMPSVPPDKGGPPGDPREEGLGIHGSASETSLVLYLHPEAVDMSLAERHIPSFINEYRHVGLSGTAEFGWLSSDLDPSGVAGDPTLATPEDGKRIFEGAVDRVVEALAEVSRFEFPDAV